MIDAHQHFWRLDRGDYGWLTPAVGPIYRDYLPEHLAPALARNGITSTILVQAAPTVAETRFMLELARAAPFVAGVVGWVDFEAADVADVIGNLAIDEKLVGLRPMIQDIAETGWMLEARLTAAYETMIEHDLVFDALVLPRHLPGLRELVARHPQLNVVLDHAAKPPLKDGNLTDWKREITFLARAPNVVCKLSGLVTEAGSADPATLRDAVDHLLERFGPERLMWGSDWPVCELVCSYDTWRATSDTLLASLTDAQRAFIHSATARKTYGI
ncbi:MAG TPA: amidohydrolase family protein [Steroidobacteraceae bacterium]|nr:amidohydrolase family protein [Steroidobacteraceae bacterium]